MDAAGFCLFETPIGACGLAWTERSIVGVLLPDDRGPAGTRARMQHSFPTALLSEPPAWVAAIAARIRQLLEGCLLYTSPSPRDRQKSRMPSSA